jgi:transcriptional/translational regulatory protein YebC/TACO1
MFDEKGQIIVAKEEVEMDGDDLMMMALDAGAEDFSEEEDSFVILTAPADFSAVREELEKQSVPMADAEVLMLPQNYVDLSDETDIKNFERIIEFLDDDDDVQEVFHNASYDD